MITPRESLTENFYLWEKRGRGWKVWEAPVDLEPTFVPFIHSYATPSAAPIDDGRKPTRVGSWFSRLLGNSSDAYRVATNLEQYSREPEPEYCYDDSHLVEIQISLAPDRQITKQTAEQFILSLTSIRLPASFEIIGTQSSIIFQITCRELDGSRVRSQLRAFFPDAVVSVASQSLRELWTDDSESVVIEF